MQWGIAAPGPAAGFLEGIALSMPWLEQTEMTNDDASETTRSIGA
jgi:hypothetical protein